MISDKTKEETEQWFTENYNGKLNLLEIHEIVIKKRVLFLENIHKEDPLATVNFKPIIHYYKEEIQNIYKRK